MSQICFTKAVINVSVVYIGNTIKEAKNQGVIIYSRVAYFFPCFLEHFPACTVHKTILTIFVATLTREMSLIIQCVGKAASKSQAQELSQQCNTIVSIFLAPSLSDCKESPSIRESVLTAVSELAAALKLVLQTQQDFSLPMHDQLLQSAILILQNNSLALSSRQSALQCLTSLIELPPNISQAIM